VPRAVASPGRVPTGSGPRSPIEVNIVADGPNLRDARRPDEDPENPKSHSWCQTFRDHGSREFCRCAPAPCLRSCSRSLRRPALRRAKLLNAARPLTAVEIASVLDTSRRAVARKTFHASALSGRHSLDVRVDRSGRPKIVRTAFGLEAGIVFGGPACAPAPSFPTEMRWHEDVVSIVEYTGRPPRRCDGSVEPGEMVVSYTLSSRSSSWTTEGRRRDPTEIQHANVERAFELLRGIAPLTSGERCSIGGRRARAFVAPWTPPPDRSGHAPILTGDPIPNVAGEPSQTEAKESLWIDVQSLLPLRWKISKHGMLMFGYDFRKVSLDLRPPPGVRAPDCIR